MASRNIQNNIDQVVNAALPFSGDIASGMNKVLIQIFENIEKERKQWAANKDVYTSSGEPMEKILDKFSIVTPYTGESEISALKRVKSVYARESPVLGTRQDVKNVFSFLLESESVFVINNSELIANSLLLNGDFEAEINEAWILKGAASLEKRNQFEGTMALKLSGGSAKQTVQLKEKTVYCLHGFYNGDNVNIAIKSGSKYWDSTGEIGSWIDKETLKKLPAVDTYTPFQIFVVTEETTDFEVSFSGTGYIDYVRLFEKDATSMFSVICIMQDVATDKTATLGRGESDPIDGIDYDKQSYLDDTYIIGGNGVKSINFYKKVLDIIKPAGIYGVIELLNIQN